MKKLNQLLALMMIVAITAFSACSDDPGEAPTVNVTEVAGADYTPGSTVTYIVTASTNDELSMLTVTGDIINPNFSMAYDGGLSTSTDSLMLEIPEGLAAGSTVNLTFMVTTDEEGEASVTKSFTVVEAIPAMGSYTGVTLTYTSTNTNDANFFSATDGAAYDASATASMLDLALAWQTSYGPSIVSPDAAWLATLWGYNSVTYDVSNKNTTKIATCSEDFDAADGSTLDALDVTSSTVDGGGNGVQNLINGDVLKFETADGKKGLARINISRVTYSLSLDVKVQSAATAK